MSDPESTQRLVANHNAVLPFVGFYSQRHQDALISVEQGVTALADRTFEAPARVIGAEISVHSGALVFRHGESAADVAIGDRYIGPAERRAFQVPTGGRVVVQSVDGASLGGTASFSLVWLLSAE